MYSLHLEIKKHRCMFLHVAWFRCFPKDHPFAETLQVDATVTHLSFSSI